MIYQQDQDQDQNQDSEFFDLRNEFHADNDLVEDYNQEQTTQELISEKDSNFGNQDDVIDKISELIEEEINDDEIKEMSDNNLNIETQNFEEDEYAEPQNNNSQVKENNDKSKQNKNEEIKNNNETIKISKTKLLLIKKILNNLKEGIEQLDEMFDVFLPEENELIFTKKDELEEDDNKKNVIEGIFNGQNMIGPDGKKYTVPVNYASKSKMVEGDILKLTITKKGHFLYKQIGPIERVRIIGKLAINKDGDYVVVSGNKSWKVLKASVTYFKGEVGDEVILILPKTGESKWGAIENIVKK